jgi:hypothetical protein
MALCVSRVAAQSEPAAPPDRSEGEAGQTGEITADEEITVIGQRSLRLLRLEVQTARERVYGLFNSLNSSDEFDIHCRNAPRTGTRIPQRVCRPQFADNATDHAGTEFLLALQLGNCAGGITEACLEAGRSRAQAALSVVSVRDRQLDAEVQRLARDNAEFRRAIAGFQAVERRYEDARRAEGLALRVSASIIDSAGAAIPSSLAVQDQVVFPEAIEIVTPEAYWSGLDEGDVREGWVKLRYSVLADGTTADVRVVDAMPAGLDPLAALVAVQAWGFEPAMADGVPIDWHNNLAVIAFNREQAVHEAWPEFAETYEEVADLTSRARYAEAKSRNERMQSELAVTLEEMAFAQMQLAAIEHALADPHAALDAIRRATEPAVHQLADEELMLALEHRFTLEIELGLAADALETYERRIERGRLQSRDAMARLGEALGQTLTAPETSLAVQGRIGGGGQWEHSLTWPVFAVGDVDGRNENLEVECNRNKAALPFEADVQMTIPAGWGECVLFVRGEPGTTFVVYEFKQPVD